MRGFLSVGAALLFLVGGAPTTALAQFNSGDAFRLGTGLLYQMSREPERPRRVRPREAQRQYRYERRAEIREIQRRLDALGYPVGAADGALGPRTRRAIRLYQRDAGLPVTGRPDDLLVTTLRDSSARQAATRGPGTAGQSADGPPIGSSSLASTTFSILDGYDLPNGDYRSGMTDRRLRRVSVMACQRFCATDRRCRAFTYNANARVCMLKDTVGQRAPFAGAISGIKGAAAPGGLAAADGARDDDGPRGASLAVSAPVSLPLPSGVRQIAPVRSGGRIVAGYQIMYGSHKGGDIMIGRRHYIRSHFDLALFTDLLLLKRWPKIAKDQRVARTYATRFLTGAMRDRFIADCRFSCSRNVPYDGWQGQNEFEREASYKAFLAEIVPLLRDAGPDLPLRTISVQEVEIRPYDEKKQVFPLRIVRPTTFLGTVRTAANFDLKNKGEVPAAIPMSRAQAEEFVSRFPPGKRIAYIALEKTLGQPEWDDSPLNRPVLTLEITRARLFADPDGSVLLHAFTRKAEPVAIDRPALGGLPAVDGRVLVRGSSGRWNLPPSEAVRKLGKLVLFTAIKQTPDVFDDDDLAFASLTLLDPRLQRKLVADSGLDPDKVLKNRRWYWRKLDEFDRRALLRKIRSDVPAIVEARALDLPIPVMILCSVSLEEYDFDKQQFPVDRSVDACDTIRMDTSGHGEADLFSLGRLTVTGPLERQYLPKAISVPLNEAKAYKERFTRNGKERAAILGVEAKLTSLVEKKKDDKRRYFEFKIDFDGVAIFHKDNLSAPIDRLELVPMASAATIDTKPRGPVPLNFETLNLMMLARQTVSFDTSAFRRWATYRAFLEGLKDDQNYYGRDPWVHFFREEIRKKLSYKRPVESALIKNFGEWNKARAKALPDTVYLQTRRASLKSMMSDDGRKPGRIGVFNRPGSSYGRTYARLSKHLAIPEAQLLRARDISSGWIDADRLIGIRKGTEIVLVLPAPKSAYAIALDQGQKPGKGYLDVRTSLRVINIRLDQVDKDGTLLLVDVEPVSARVAAPELGNRELGSATFDAAFPTAEGSLPAQRYGADAPNRLRKRLKTADMAGIRLGMTMEEAAKHVRSDMDVGWAGVLSDNLTTREKVFDDFVSYFSKDGNQSISLFFHPSQPDRVIAAARTIFFPERIPDETLRKNLEDKYGPAETYGGSGQLVWVTERGRTITSDRKMGTDPAADFRSGTCFATVRSTWEITSFRLREGKKPESYQDRQKIIAHAPQILMANGASGDVEKLMADPQTWKYCGPAVVAQFGPWGNGSLLTYALYDLAAYGKLFPPPSPEEAETAKAPAVPKL